MDNNKLTRARNILKTIHTDKDDKFAFSPVTVIDHPDYTVLVAPVVMGMGEDPPLTVTIHNNTLTTLLDYAVLFAEGDERFDDFDGFVEYDFDDDVTDCFAAIFYEGTCIEHGVTKINESMNDMMKTAA